MLAKNEYIDFETNICELTLMDDSIIKVNIFGFKDIMWASPLTNPPLIKFELFET